MENEKRQLKDEYERLLNLYIDKRDNLNTDGLNYLEIQQKRIELTSEFLDNDAIKLGKLTDEIERNYKGEDIEILRSVMRSLLEKYIVNITSEIAYG